MRSAPAPDGVARELPWPRRRGLEPLRCDCRAASAHPPAQRRTYGVSRRGSSPRNERDGTGSPATPGLPRAVAERGRDR